MAFLATTKRPPGTPQDPHGPGAVYWVAGDWSCKRWISKAAYLPAYEALFGPVQDETVHAFVLDAAVEMAPIDAVHPAMPAAATQPLPT